ncbi:hypothetical protein [Luteimonas suaedae]|uniref:hypothetical protein n=1 Tax=Luteimonas suaedae TaxID=2605430 RepID=UPI0011EE4723|nr:hypothetical protein [Luteimonas suaedae]
MTIVFEMSTDPDITATPLAPAWHPIAARYGWPQVSPCNLGLPGGITLVVIAHGNGTEIGNAAPGTIDIGAAAFLALIQGNMAGGAFPAAVYISTCGPGIAEFAAAVRLLAEQNDVWDGTRIFGHSDPVAGAVPPPGDIRWAQIF